VETGGVGGADGALSGKVGGADRGIAKFGCHATP